MTVCLVEDYPHLREMLCDLLVESGAHVLSAVGTLRAGQESIAYHRPDVAVIDNRLPDGRGIDLIRTLAHTEPGIALLLHSGAATNEDAREAFHAGAAGVILKSIRGHSLIDAIQITAGASRPDPLSPAGYRATPGRRPFRSRPSYRPRN